MPPLNDPRLICPQCGLLVEVNAERFEDIFEDPKDAADAGPTYHSTCVDQAIEDAPSTGRVYEYPRGYKGPLSSP